VSPVPGRIALADEATVEALARAVPARFYALVLLVRFTALRWNEAVALRRRRCHGTARLWEWMHEATAQRASLRTGSDQRRGGVSNG
jgi:hypothetical protein